MTDTCPCRLAATMLPLLEEPVPWDASPMDMAFQVVIIDMCSLWLLPSPSTRSALRSQSLRLLRKHGSRFLRLRGVAGEDKVGVGVGEGEGG